MTQSQVSSVQNMTNSHPELIEFFGLTVREEGSELVISSIKEGSRHLEFSENGMILQRREMTVHLPLIPFSF